MSSRVGGGTDDLLMQQMGCFTRASRSIRGGLLAQSEIARVGQLIGSNR